MPILTLFSKSMPSTNSRKPCTKCWCDCAQPLLFGFDRLVEHIDRVHAARIAAYADARRVGCLVGADLLLLEERPVLLERELDLAEHHVGHGLVLRRLVLALRPEVMR